MHNAAYKFVRKHRDRHAGAVVEIGSRDINGSVRDLFATDEYVGLDLYDGPGVDWVGDACDFSPGRSVDAVVCCEVLEHAAEWEEIVITAADWLKPGGELLITCAGPGRKPHSAIDGKHRLHEGEHYANVSADELAEVMETAGLEVRICRELGEDTRAVGKK